MQKSDVVPEKKINAKLVRDDVWLKPFSFEIEGRTKAFVQKKKEIENRYGSLKKFAKAYQFLGLNYDKKKGAWMYREWAPRAKALFLCGDFNDWDRKSHPLKKNANGIWEIELKASELKANTLFKLSVESARGTEDRLPAYARYTIQDSESLDFSACAYRAQKFEWTDAHFKPKNKKHPLIYEVHVGMSTELEGCSSFEDFRTQILPRIVDLGYDTIQLMGIQEHPYYASFGYHVSSFFAVSSRFGTVEDFKRLVNEAHELGISVIMDLVHSHAIKNNAEGLNHFDGSENQYFHAGEKGYHELWDSKLFDYGKEEVLQFLLSNLRFWIKEFHLDGFRFDGVTSMLYSHHGCFMNFSSYQQYFDASVDREALLYLQLANTLLHELKPDAISIAEEMSGMPGTCYAPEEGGLGFDFRLGMGIPDYWIKLIKEKKDEEWNVSELWATLTNRRKHEPVVAYAESHDQALVGDKSIAFRLMDKEMYWSMDKFSENEIVDRGIALHKMIRLISLSLGGDAYLNFVGNEFGHPEWIDFPRKGNDWSYEHARRQWSLVDNKLLKYHYLADFDKKMLHLNKKYDLLKDSEIRLINLDEQNQILIFSRANLIFVFSFNPSVSIPDYHFKLLDTNKNQKFKIVLTSDDLEFGGFGRVDTDYEYHSNKEILSIYIPNRTALVFRRL